MSDSIVITGLARTPMGGMLGDLGAQSAHQLGTVAIQAAVERAAVAADAVDEVIMGNVLMAGQGQAPARQAALGAGLAPSTSCSTLNKMCGSGMKTIMLAHDLLLAGTNDVMVAGGMESMTNAPHLLPKGRTGLRIGHGQVYDHMMLDGLEDAYQPGTAMGVFAEATAEKYGFTREAQDKFAIESLHRAQQAGEDGSFDAEIAPVTVKTRKGEVVVNADEQPGKGRPDKIPQLRPAFVKDGTVTAANASSISDGAAALVMMRESIAQAKGSQPIARIIGHASFAHEPEWFTTAPVGAIQSLLTQTGWSADEVDLWEINEAFAVVTMAAMQDINIPHDRVNIHGGACALGHPIGASGARIVVTLLSALQKTGGKKGIAALCIGGGEATAIAIEMV